MLSFHAVRRVDRKEIHASKVGEKKSLKFVLQSSRMWHQIIQQIHANILEEPGASPLIE
jgi:hypothetical protein